MNASDENLLSTALHDRVGEATPDLDALVLTSVRRGGRIRRTRFALAGLGAAAVVAATGIGASALAGGGATPVTVDSAFADASSTTAASAPHQLAAGDTIKLPSGAVAKAYQLGQQVPPGAWPDGMAVQPVPVIVIPSDAATDDADPSGLFVIAVGATDADLEWMQTQYADSTVPILVTRGPSTDSSDVAPLPPADTSPAS